MKRRLLIYGLALLAVFGYLQWHAVPPAPLEVAVMRDGLVRFRGEVVPVTELAGHVKTELKRDPQRPVRVMVDAQAPSTVLIPVLDALTQGGAENVKVVAE